MSKDLLATVWEKENSKIDIKVFHGFGTVKVLNTNHKIQASNTCIQLNWCIVSKGDMLRSTDTGHKHDTSRTRGHVILKKYKIWTRQGHVY